MRRSVSLLLLLFVLAPTSFAQFRSQDDEGKLRETVEDVRPKIGATQTLLRQREKMRTRMEMQCKGLDITTKDPVCHAYWLFVNRCIERNIPYGLEIKCPDLTELDAIRRLSDKYRDDPAQMEEEKDGSPKKTPKKVETTSPRPKGKEDSLDKEHIEEVNKRVLLRQALHSENCSPTLPDHEFKLCMVLLRDKARVETPKGLLNDIANHRKGLYGKEATLAERRKVLRERREGIVNKDLKRGPVPMHPKDYQLP